MLNASSLQFKILLCLYLRPISKCYPHIFAAVGCAHTTVFYELRRGTPDRKSKHGRAPQYMAKRGQRAYAENRKNSRKPCKINHDDCELFIQCGGTSPPGTLVTGCLRWLCQAKQAIYAETDSLYQDVLQHAVG